MSTDESNSNRDNEEEKENTETSVKVQLLEVNEENVLFWCFIYREEFDSMEYFIPFSQLSFPESSKDQSQRSLFRYV